MRRGILQTSSKDTVVIGAGGGDGQVGLPAAQGSAVVSNSSEGEWGPGIFYAVNLPFHKRVSSGGDFFVIYNWEPILRKTT